jgi:hypothetical protein
MKPKPEKIIAEEKAPQKKSLTKKVLDALDLGLIPTSFIRHYQERHGKVHDNKYYPIIFCELARIGGYAGLLYGAKNMIFPGQ